jgi:hypothetical protein
MGSSPLTNFPLSDVQKQNQRNQLLDLGPSMLKRKHCILPHEMPQRRSWNLVFQLCMLAAPLLPSSPWHRDTREEIQANLASLRSQEAGFDKYYRDCHLPQVAHEVGSLVQHAQSPWRLFSFFSRNPLFASLISIHRCFKSLDHFARRRSTLPVKHVCQICLERFQSPLNNFNDQTVQENAPMRQEALKIFSKNARQQLEEARQNERVCVCAYPLASRWDALCEPN